MLSKDHQKDPNDIEVENEEPLVGQPLTKDPKQKYSILPTWRINQNKLRIMNHYPAAPNAGMAAQDVLAARTEILVTPLSRATWIKAR